MNIQTEAKEIAAMASGLAARAVRVLAVEAGKLGSSIDLLKEIPIEGLATEAIDLACAALHAELTKASASLEGLQRAIERQRKQA